MKYKYSRGKYDENNNLISIRGYKSLNNDGTNYYGKKFDVGKIYHCDGEIKFGPTGNGYHFAYNIEDTIRYSGEDYNLKDIIIAEVIGREKIIKGEDIYNGYDDLFVTSSLEILKYLTREEVISMALDMSDTRLIRFVSQYKLTPEEQELFYYSSASVAQTIDYYQRGIKDAYQNGTKYLKFKR